jgi:ATP-binding protein involved in chromosome partitioning
VKNKSGSGLELEGHSEIFDRLLEITKGQHNWQIHVGSDGLKLDNKMLIEKHLLNDLGRKYPKEPFTVYFRRTKKNDVNEFEHVGPNQPLASTQTSKPLGLNIKKKPIPGIKNVLVVSSGKGGVGKSTISTNLAVAMAKNGEKVGFLDADIYGPSGPTMLGIQAPMEVHENGKLNPTSAYGVEMVSFGFLSDAFNPVIWRGPLVSKAIKQLCYDVNWGSLDTLIIDLPPGTGDVQLSLIENLPIEGAIIVSTPQDIALIDAHKALSMFENLGVPTIGLVENMSGYTCTNCGHSDHIFGEGGGSDFARTRNIPILAHIPLHPSIRMACDTGQPISLQNSRPQAKIFEKLAQKVSLYFSSNEHKN